MSLFGIGNNILTNKPATNLSQNPVVDNKSSNICKQISFTNIFNIINNPELLKNQFITELLNELPDSNLSVSTNEFSIDNQTTLINIVPQMINIFSSINSDIYQGSIILNATTFSLNGSMSLSGFNITSNLSCLYLSVTSFINTDINFKFINKNTNNIKSPYCSLNKYLTQINQQAAIETGNNKKFMRVAKYIGGNTNDVMVTGSNVVFITDANINNMIIYTSVPIYLIVSNANVNVTIKFILDTSKYIELLGINPNLSIPKNDSGLLTNANSNNTSIAYASPDVNKIILFSVLGTVGVIGIIYLSMYLQKKN
jgi:hypothetical protein